MAEKEKSLLVMVLEKLVKENSEFSISIQGKDIKGKQILDEIRNESDFGNRIEQYIMARFYTH